MIVYITEGHVSDAAFCFEYETDDEAKLLDAFLNLARKSGGLTFRSVEEADILKPSGVLEDLLRDNPIDS